MLRLGLLAGIAGGLAPTVAAEPWQEADDPSMRDAAALLWERNREVLHEGDPLALAGLDQGDEGFRARTPALLRSDRATALVDPDENYRRRLALYEDRASFHHPLPVARPPEDPGTTPRRAEAPRPVEAATETSPSSWWWAGIAGFLALAGLALLVARGGLRKSGASRV